MRYYVSVRRVAHQIPDSILNNVELQTAVKQVCFKLIYPPISSIIIKRIDSVNQDCKCPQCPSKLMFKKASGTTRGHSKKLQTQRATGYRHHFFSTRVIKMWNSLSEDTVQAKTN